MEYALPDGRFLFAERRADSYWHLLIDGNSPTEIVGWPLATTIAELLGYDVGREEWPSWVIDLAAEIEASVGPGHTPSVEDIDRKLARAHEIFVDDLDDETDAELKGLLPALVAAGYVVISGESPTGHFWSFTQEGVARADLLGLD